mmetsp:Transcript_10893/g.34050  ORF Transcript_10893/g.34050 Transcript_10893/m.34050 type:complete len:247 (+) Transcript_10893:530-1270(+)
MPAAVSTGSPPEHTHAEGADELLAPRAGQPEVPVQALDRFGDASCLVQSSGRPLLQAASRSCSPWPQSLEHAPHGPRDHLQPAAWKQGSVSTASPWPGTRLQAFGARPPSFGVHEALRVLVPGPQAAEQADHGEVHSQPSVPLHDCFRGGCGECARQSSGRLPFAQATLRVWTPSPHWLEQGDQSPRCHLQPETSWHSPSLGGGLPSWLAHRASSSLGQRTVLVRVPRPHLSEHGDHLLVFHLHPS